MINRLYNALWFIVGGSILLVAVAITVARLLLPGIDHYRGEIELWAGNYMGLPVSIQSVKAQWHGWNPELTLYGVVLQEPDGHEALTSFDSASIKFSSLASLYRWEPVPAGLTISGAQLKLTHTAEGSIRIGDSTIAGDDYAGPRDNQLSRWLMRQPYLSLRDTNLLWIDEYNAQPAIKLSNANLHLNSYRRQTQISGSARLPEHYGDSIDFAIDADGDLLGGEWSAEIYLDARQIKPAAWPQYSRWHELELRAGSTDITVWSQWQDGILLDAEGLVSAEDVLVRDDNSSNLIRRFRGQFDYLRHADDHWTLAAAIQELSTWNDDWPVTHLRLSGQQPRTIDSGFISYVLIQDLLPFFNGIEISAVEASIADSTSGELSNLQFDFGSDPGVWQASGQLDNLTIRRSYGNEAFSGLNGIFAANQNGGRIKLDSSNMSIGGTDVFISPIDALDLHGQITWNSYQDNSRLYLHTDDLEIATDTHKLQISGNAEFDDRGLPTVNVAASLSGGDATTLKRFVPAAAKDKLKTWAQRAIVEGRLEQAALVLRGDLDDFPFRERQGQFKLHAWFNGLTLDYHEEWPTIYQLDGELLVDRYRLEARVPHAKTYNADIRNVDAYIADLFVEDHILNLKCEAEGSTEDAVSFLRDSPLDEKEKSIRRMLELDYAGDIALDLDMVIKLYPGEDDISGQVELLGNTVVAPQLDIRLTDARGVVKFSRDKLESRNITAKYAGRDVDVELERNGDASSEPTLIRIEGIADSSLITELLTEHTPPETLDDQALANILQGASHWQFEYTAPVDPAAVETIRLNSDLKGLGLDLPAPVGKVRDETRNLEIKLSLPQKQQAENRIFLTYGEILSAVYGSGQFAARFGNSVLPDLPTGNNIIDGSIDRLDMDRWITLIAESDLILSDAGITNPASIPDIDLFVDQLKLQDQTFRKTRLTFSHTNDTSRLVLQGTEVDGWIQLPDSSQEPKLTARFKTLQLDKVSDNDTDERQTLNPRDLPALSITVDNLIYNEANFGALNLQAEKASNGLIIQDFSFSKPSMEITGTGSWKTVNNEIFSQFNIELKAERFASMLSTFGYDEKAVEQGKTHIKVDALWPGSPMNFNLARLDGTLELDIGKGQFLEIDPKAVRLLGLLSVSTLPRRLLLDFNDIFEEGFAFDRIKGTFTLQDGQAFTSDLSMEGPAALITATGRTGLVDQTYDQIITIIPQISNTLPVAGALFGPAGIGIGAVIFLAGKVFEGIPEQIDKVLGYRYTVEGSWDDPVIKPVQPSQAREKNPLESARPSP